jgi:hypothetical protein
MTTQNTTTRRHYQDMCREHAKNLKTYKVILIHDSEGYFLHRPDGKGDIDLGNVEYYDAAVMAMEHHPFADIRFGG